MIFLEEGREWRLPGLLYAGDLVLSWRRNLGRWWDVSLRCEGEVWKSVKVMVLGGGGREIRVDGARILGVCFV